LSWEQSQHLLIDTGKARKEEQEEEEEEEVTRRHKHVITQGCFFKQIPALKCLNWPPYKITFL